MDIQPKNKNGKTSTGGSYEICEKMMLGEMSAVTTYGLAIETFSDNAELASPLTTIRNEHQQSVEDLRERIETMGKIPTQTPGLWQPFAELVQTTANRIGRIAALDPLQLGETKGITDYENALDDESLSTGCRELFGYLLVPRLRKHMTALEELKHLPQ